MKTLYNYVVIKSYRNNRIYTVLKFDIIPTEDELEDAVHTWAENEGSGNNHGYTVFWDEDMYYITHTEVK